MLMLANLVDKLCMGVLAGHRQAYLISGKSD